MVKYVAKAKSERLLPKSKKQVKLLKRSIEKRVVFVEHVKINQRVDHTVNSSINGSTWR